ncbi:transposase [Streptomyces sp. SID5470]|nr:transposase [Streptomyces sp. SID5470]
MAAPEPSPRHSELPIQPDDHDTKPSQLAAWPRQSSSLRSADPSLGCRFPIHVVQARRALDRDGIAASIGSVGDAYDNALMESTIGLYKTELIKPQRPWKTLAEVELATAEWIDWYNFRRLHGEIGHVPPAEYEASHYQTTQKPQVTATF